MNSENRRPGAGPGTSGHAPVDPAVSPDTEPDDEVNPPQASPDASEVKEDEVVDDEE